MKTLESTANHTRSVSLDDSSSKKISSSLTDPKSTNGHDATVGSFESVFKAPQCLHFTRKYFSYPYKHESEAEKIISLELLKEIGVDPKAKRCKEQYQRFALKDGEVKSFMNKAFPLIKEHYLLLAKTTPKPNTECMDWAKLDPTFKAELSFSDGKPKRDA